MVELMFNCGVERNQKHHDVKKACLLFFLLALARQSLQFLLFFRVLLSLTCRHLVRLIKNYQLMVVVGQWTGRERGGGKG